MKIAVSAAGTAAESALDPRFGRAAAFVIAETETDIMEALDNSAAASSGGAGIAAAQFVAENGAKAVITGNVGPNAMRVLKAAEIEIYKGAAASVRENIELFRQGKLEKLASTVPAHHGMR